MTLNLKIFVWVFEYPHLIFDKSMKVVGLFHGYLQLKELGLLYI